MLDQLEKHDMLFITNSKDSIVKIQNVKNKSSEDAQHVIVLHTNINQSLFQCYLELLQ